MKYTSNILNLHVTATKITNQAGSNTTCMINKNKKKTQNAHIFCSFFLFAFETVQNYFISDFNTHALQMMNLNSNKIAFWKFSNIFLQLLFEWTKNSTQLTRKTNMFFFFEVLYLTMDMSNSLGLNRKSSGK